MNESETKCVDCGSTEFDEGDDGDLFCVNCGQSHPDVIAAGGSDGDESNEKFLNALKPYGLGLDDLTYITYKAGRDSVTVVHNDPDSNGSHNVIDGDLLRRLGIKASELGSWLGDNGARPLRTARRKPPSSFMD